MIRLALPQAFPALFAIIQMASGKLLINPWGFGSPTKCGVAGSRVLWGIWFKLGQLLRSNWTASRRLLCFPSPQKFQKPHWGYRKLPRRFLAEVVNNFFLEWHDRILSPAVSGYDRLYIYQNYAHGDESLSAIYGNPEWRHERLTALKNKYDPHSLFNGQCTSPLRCAIYLPLALYNISILPPSYDRSSFHCMAWTFLLDSCGRIEPHQTISEFLYAL